MVKKVNEKEFKEVMGSGVVVIDFSATWCGPCQMLAPVMEQVSEEMDGKASFYNIDVDENPNISREYSIMNIPAIVVLKDGKKVEMEVGFQPKENICGFIEKHL